MRALRANTPVWSAAALLHIALGCVIEVGGKIQIVFIPSMKGVETVESIRVHTMACSTGKRVHHLSSDVQINSFGSHSHQHQNVEKELLVTDGV